VEVRRLHSCDLLSNQRRNTYGNTSGWLGSVNADLNSINGYLRATTQLGVYNQNALAGMPDYEQARVKSQYASVELADGANMNALSTIGAIRGNAAALAYSVKAPVVHSLVASSANSGATPARWREPHGISSAPMKQLVHGITPRVPESVLKAATSLRYRDFLTVVLILKDRGAFDDNWIYIHDPSVKVGRVQNFKSWSPEMVPDPSMNCYGLEYFCFEGDGLWTMDDSALIALARNEVASLGICAADEVFDGVVVRQQKAYPVYDDEYRENVEVIREYLATSLPNLHVVGRNGMHKYNNQDHSMMTALLVARNIAGGSNFDPWKVNADAVYHEDIRAGDRDPAARLVPERIAAG